VNEDTLKQAKLLSSRKNHEWKRGELHTSNKELFNDNGKFTVMHTNAQTLRTDADHTNRNKIRVAVSLSGYPTFNVITDGYVSQACFWTEFSTVEEATSFAKECNSTEIQDILKIFKWSGWNSKEVISCL
jgi:hypothetical protein